jgi:protein TonB
MKMLLALAVVALFGAQDSTIYTPGNGVSLPEIVKKVNAGYTEDAKQNRIEGNVGLGAVVLADGKVGDVAVEESLDSIYGLDKNAVAAMKQWVFKPGVKDGKPVAVRIHVQMAFTLK